MNRKTPAADVVMGAGEELVTMELPCALSKDDLLRVGQSIADAITARQAAASRMKLETSELRKQIRAHDHDVAELQQKLATKKELRAVPCAVVLDGVRLMVRTVRLDTNELVAERPMSPEERQAQLFPEAVPEVATAETERPNESSPRRSSRRSGRAA